MSRRALVTGAAGFAGQWLCRELLGRGWEVVGTMLGDVVDTGTLGLDERRAVHWVRLDVRNLHDVTRALDASRPDIVFHLAGVTFVPEAGEDPGLAVEVNAGGAARLLGEIRRRRQAGTLDPVVLIVGSGEQYGRHEAAEMPLPESAGQYPLSVYAASKSAQEIVALQTWRADGVRVIATRSFNHSGPGQGERFLLPALVSRAMALRSQWRAELAVGNTDPVRDYLHVSDVARAYVLLVERGRPGEVYNVASGVGNEVAELARRVLALAGAEAKLVTDPALVRPVDVPVLVGDAAKLRAETGWSPERDLDSIIKDLIRAASQ